MTDTKKATEPMFFYARGDTHFGPVFESDFKTMCLSGQIQPDDRVWSRSIGPQWVDAGTLNIFGGQKPSALIDVPELWFYILLLSPLITTFLGLIYMPMMVVGGLLIHFIIPILDITEVRRAGHDDFSKWHYLLALLILPLYLFFRIRKTQSPNYLALLLYLMATLTSALIRWTVEVPVGLSLL